MTRVRDKKLLRLLQYLQYSLDYRLTASCQDDPKDLRLELYVDADFGGDSGDVKSTSGGFLTLKGPNTFFPLAWISKRQTSTSRSTTESEVVSLALFVPGGHTCPPTLGETLAKAGGLNHP